MKPACQFTSRKRRFPLTDYFFQSHFREWWGYWSPNDDESRRRFHNSSRKLLHEYAREQKKETIVFGLVVLMAAWPVVYAIMSIVQLLLKGQPIGN